MKGLPAGEYAFFHLYAYFSKPRLQTLILPVEGVLFSVSRDQFPGRLGGSRLRPTGICASRDGSEDGNNMYQYLKTENSDDSFRDY